MSDAFITFLYIVVLVGAIPSLFLLLAELKDITPAINRFIDSRLKRGEVSEIGSTRPTTGVASADFQFDAERGRPIGKIRVSGEIWQAVSSYPEAEIRKGQSVKILEVDGLTLRVEPVREDADQIRSLDV